MKQDFALKIIEETRKNYNQIASSYHQTKRPAIWQASKDLFLRHLNKQDTVLDLGCGDGRLAKLLSPYQVSYFGIDISEKMIEVAKSNYGNLGTFQIMSDFNLPFPDNYFNVVYCIGTLHHIPSKNFRIKLLKEIKRVSKPYGYLIMTNWYLFKKPYLKKIIKQNIKKTFFLTPFDFNDIEILWKKDQKKPAKRYYHAFTQAEIYYLLTKSSLKTIDIGLTYFNKKPRNIFTVAQNTVLKPVFIEKETGLVGNIT